MRKNFYLSLLIIFIIGIGVFILGYDEGVDFIIFSYFSLFVYGMVVKLALKNKKLYVFHGR